jgi:ACS family glucarate transporter-like MFS transporter
MNLNPYQSSAAPAEQVGPLALPTRVRLLVVAIVTGMSVLLYLDRFAINAATGAILTDLQLNEEQFGRAVGAFFLAYALMQVPCGWLSDAFGGRATLALYVVGWSLCTIALGFANGLLAITLLRVLLGVTQAGAYPAAASLLKQWIPVQERASANGSVAMGGRAGGLAAFALTPILALAAGQALGIQTGQWRVVFMSYGMLGLVWAAAFVWFFRNSPREHRWCNAAEARLVEGGLDTGKSKRTALPIVAMLTSKNLWLLSISGFLVNIGWIFLSGWLVHYLTVRFGTSLEATVGPKRVVAGLCTALTALGGVSGSLLGGFIADACRRRFGPIWGRRIPGMAAGSLAACTYLLSQYATNVWTFTAAMVLISFLVDLGLGSLWATYQDIGGRHVASVLGFANMCGNLGAAWFGYYIGVFAKADRWNTVFLISAAALFGMAFSWLFVDPTQPITREESTGL